MYSDVNRGPKAERFWYSKALEMFSRIHRSIYSVNGLPLLDIVHWCAGHQRAIHGRESVIILINITLAEPRGDACHARYELICAQPCRTLFGRRVGRGIHASAATVLALVAREVAKYAGRLVHHREVCEDERVPHQRPEESGGEGEERVRGMNRVSAGLLGQGGEAALVERGLPWVEP